MTPRRPPLLRADSRPPCRLLLSTFVSILRSTVDQLDAQCDGNLPCPPSFLQVGMRCSCAWMSLRRRIADSSTAFSDVFRNENLRRLELAWAASIVGNWAYLVAVSVYAYGVGGEAAVGLIFFLRLVPAALIAPFAGLLARPLPQGARPAHHESRCASSHRRGGRVRLPRRPAQRSSTRSRSPQRSSRRRSARRRPR